MWLGSRLQAIVFAQAKLLTRHRAYLKIFLLCLFLVILGEARVWFILPFFAKLNYRFAGTLFLNGTIVFCLFGVVHFVIAKKWTAFTLSLFPLLILLIADTLKRRYCLTPLVPTDFYKTGLALNVFAVFFHWTIQVGIAAVLCFSVALIIFVLRREKASATLKQRSAVLLIGWSLVSLCLVSHPWVRAVVSSFASISRHNHNTTKLYQANGFFLGLLLEFQSMGRTPEGYDENTVKAWLERESEKQQLTAVNPFVRRPNVILYLMESFNDPDDLELKTTEDATPFFHELKKKYSSGYLLTPQFGGGTGCTEFEVLTGLRLDHFGTDSSPYETHAWPLPAVPRQFKAYGYQTHSSHPFYGTFYGRDFGHAMVGFETADFLASYPNPKLVHSMIADEALVDEIIRKTKTMTSPSFIFGITMGGHGPYSLDLAQPEGLRVTNAVNPKLQSRLDTYVRLMRHSDEALRQLVTHFSRVKEPTIIVAFGDHTPPLGYDFYSAMSSTNVVKKAMAYANSVVPVVMWSNFPMEKRPIELPSFALGNLLHEVTGVPPAIPFLAQGYLQSDYFKFVTDKDFKPSLAIDRLSSRNQIGSKFHRDLHYYLARNRLSPAVFLKKAALAKKSYN